VPYAHPGCQLGASQAPETRTISPHPSDHNTHTPTLETEHSYEYSAGQALVRGACQEVEHTKSRRSGPRRWRGAVVWLIAAGLHPRANATTLKVAEDLADRMDYDTGHVRYCLDETASRLGISRATVKRHVGFLRELGALAWVQHGSKANIRARMGLKGYAATATVYAAVIPPAYDHAMGHTIVGSGYTARIVIDQRQAPQPVDNSPVEIPAMEERETPSLTWLREESQVQVVGGEELSTGQARTAAKVPSRRKKLKLTLTGYKITAERIGQARQLAVSIRPLVNWIQGASHDQLSWVILDMVARGWTENRILVWLNQIGQEIGAPRWRPRFPHRVIAAALMRKDHADKQHADAQGADYDQDVRHAVSPNQAFAQAARTIAGHREPTVAFPQLEEAPESIDERALLRDAAAENLTLARLFMDLRGRSETVRVYGLEVVAALDAADEMAAAGLSGWAV
jgi:AraC-like DNA-binding protein